MQLVNLMENHGELCRLQLAACTLLGCLAEGAPEDVQQLLVEIGALNQAFQVARRYGNDEKLQTEALIVFAALGKVNHAL